MASVRLNVVANFSGKVATGVLVLVLSPIYVRLIGIEAYGLVGMYAAIQAALGVLDLGLGATLNQRLAHLSASESSPDAARDMRDLVRTFEIVYGLIGAASGLGIVILAPWIGCHLLHANGLPQGTVNHSVRLMGVVFALQWPYSLYSGALSGTQRQVLLNGLNVSISFARGLGVLAALLLVGRTAEVFFEWQIVMALVNTLASHVAVWRVLPPSSVPARFRRKVLSENATFAGQVAGSSLLAVVITQLDKFLLGALLPLADLGYYTLATTLSNSLNNLIGPVSTATFPRLSQLVAYSRTTEVRSLYHKACQLMAAIILPPAVMAAFFAPQLMLAWTGNADTAAHTQRLVPLLVLGTALNGLVNIPYALQLAYGWSEFGLVQNVVSAVFVVPLVAGLVPVIGPLGGAIGWFTLNAGYVLVGIPIMHRRLLIGDFGRWLVSDVGSPLLGTIAVVATARVLLPQALGPRLSTLTILGGVGILALLAATLSTGFGRKHAGDLTWSARRRLFRASS